MKEVIISLLILIAFVCAHFLITEIKFLIIMLKIKSCERLCKKGIDERRCRKWPTKIRLLNLKMNSI